ncbi:MotA/TolQ/ExbB proton channel family protein [Blautia sp. MSJ-19]|uniref:MotA/TolQ/ExbB proton channel family protein n=1 Tax=Blautia sp. MSJ-19 TaxID=2841517 RepID=UPI001C0F251C|nr:MotA/TolQ/ExbB proton channel family protein [Blautia sp. MSJ-19]MBU5480074.1 MotA/TolQ/ExbB proton channel family protein [Blautia sp. MSJ-19]
MKKKIANVALFLLVLAAALGMTLYVGNNAMSVLVYNFVFLAIIAVVYVIGLFGGMFRMNRLSQALSDAAEELENTFEEPGRVEPDKIAALNGIFHNRYLDARMQAFTDGIAKSQEGIVDIEEYINEDDLDLHVHKRLLEMAPDLFTSIGILGTFVGLVWGLKDFQPANYEAMTSSVSSLVDGIKVAFLTSIYGIAFSIVYTSGMKSEYSALTENLQMFLDRFHTYVMPSAETESMNLLVASQKNQTAAMNQMAEQFSVKMADSFEKVITPTFKKMNDSLDTLVSSVTKCQEDAVREILNVFLKEMNTSFQAQFADFGKALNQLKDAQTDNTNYTTNLYQAMSRQFTEAYAEHEHSMQKMLEESGKLQKEYITSANQIMLDNQKIQKQQQEDYQHLADYLKEAETSSAKFWVACNQTMQKYVEAAAQGMERVSETGKGNVDVAKSNRRVIEEFDSKLQEFAQYQKLSCKTMEQVRRLLTDISVNGSGSNVQLTSGQLSQHETLEKLQETIQMQGEQQQELLEEISRNIRELSKGVQKGKFGLFR